MTARTPTRKRDAKADVPTASLCSNCNKNPACDPHTCPYKEEIHNDSEFMCDCCPDCQQECIWDI